MITLILELNFISKVSPFPKILFKKSQNPSQGLFKLISIPFAISMTWSFYVPLRNCG